MSYSNLVTASTVLADISHDAKAYGDIMQLYSGIW